MHVLLLALAVLAAATPMAAAQTSAPAGTDTISLRVRNASAFLALSLHVWPVGDNARGDDRLGREVLPAGSTWTLELPRARGCRWRIVGVYHDSDRLRDGPVVDSDICSQSDVAIAAPRGMVRGGGTGWVVSEANHVVTNHHVVNGCGGIGLRQGNDEVRLEIVVTDERDDLALLRSPRRFGPPLRLRQGGQAPRLAEPVMALGYRELFNLGGQLLALTGRVVAAEGQPAQPGVLGPLTDPNRFLHDARTWGGNSGGPLLDASGAVLGIHVARTAHPVDKDKPIVPLAVAIRIE